MKKAIVAGAAAAALYAFPAMAADLPATTPAVAPSPVYTPAPFSWTGFYAGVNAGYSWGRFGRGTSALIGKANGGTFGGTLGYNFQSGNFVGGVEGDLNWAGNSGGRNFAGPVRTSGKQQWFGTLRARAGVGVERALIYVTGGYAFGNVKMRVNDTTIPLITSASHTRHGYVIGGGLEYAFTNNISVKTEYLFTRYGSKAVFAAPYRTSSNFRASILRAGVNYHF